MLSLSKVVIQNFFGRKLQSILDFDSRDRRWIGSQIWIQDNWVFILFFDRFLWRRMCWLYMQLSWRRGRCLLLDYLSRLNFFIKPINIQMYVCLQMIHWLFEPLIFSFDDIFKEKRQSLILHFSLLHVIALLIAVVFGSGDHKIFMWCIVWGWMNNLKVESMLWQTDWLFLGFILNYFSLQWDHRRSPFWSLKLYFIRPRFLEN